MLHKFKALISILGIIALFLTTFSAISFADRGEREYRSRDSERSSRYERGDRYHRGDRYDRDDRDDDDDDDDDDVTAPTPQPPVVDPNPNPGPSQDPQCSICHPYPGTNTLPSGHRSIGGISTPTPEPTPPVVEPTPPVVEPTPPVVEPTPEPTPPVVEPTPEPTPPVVVDPGLDPQTEYNNACSMCHGQSNAGRNVPSSHLGDSRAQNLSQDQIDAINAL